MARIVWTEPTLSDLDQIADYIALDDPNAAKALVRRVFSHIERLVEHPELGSIPAELRSAREYRQLVEPPCRIFYRPNRSIIYIVDVMRGEQRLRRKNLTRSS